MGRKGKKKQSTDKEAASTSSEQKKQEEEQKKQVAQNVPQKQQVPPGPSQQQPQSQPQGAWGQRQQQQQQVAPSSSQQHPQGVLSQPQQQQVTRGPQQQQQGAWGQPSQQKPTQVLQQPKPQGLIPQQGAWGQPQQQRAKGPPPPSQQKVTQVLQEPKPQAPIPQQGTWGQPQQQRAKDSPLPPQQVMWGPPTSQQQGTWGRGQPPPQQQGAWGRGRPPPQQQGAWGQPKSLQQQGVGSQPQQLQTQGPQQLQAQGLQQQQAAWSQSLSQPGAQGPQLQQQKALGGQPQQLQAQGPQQLQAQGLQQQQVAWSQSLSQPGAQSPQLQQQKPWGQPQKAWGGQPQQLQTQGPQQQQAAWSQSLSQSGAQGSQPQQQKPWGQPQLQQQSVDIGAAGDSKLVTGKGSVMRSDTQQPKPSTSVQFEGDTAKSTKITQAGKMSSAALKQYQLSIPKRKDPMKAGTKGIPIRVYTNMFEIIFDKNFETNAVHYDVNITPIASKSLYRQVFEQCRVNNFQNRFPAFDGKKNAYSANDLPFDDSMETEIEIYDKEREIRRKFKISLKKVANIDLSWIKNLRPGLDEANRDQTGIQVLDIIMRHAPESRNLSIGRSLFWKIDDSISLGNGFSLSSGGFISAILGWKPYINIDVSHKGFPKCQNVINLMAELMNPRGYNGENPNPDEVNQRWNRDKIEKYLKGLRVIYQIPNQPRTKRTYRINGIGPTAYEHQFEYEGNMITVAEYFKRVKNYQLRFPDLPCLWAGAINRNNYLPPELCTIMEGQNVNRKLDEEQTRSMIRHTAKGAPERKQKIENAYQQINVNTSNTMKDEFHLSVRSEMKLVAARILPAPELQYNGTAARVSKGIWYMQTFQHACNLEKSTWTILDLSGVVMGNFINDFVASLRQYARDVGMRIDEPQTPYRSLRSNNLREVKDYFRSKKGLKLIVVIIPDRNIDATYGKVKQITEIDEGILTQCVKCQTVRRNNNQATIKNILLKINSKLNGVNHTLTSQFIPFCLKNNDCMLVGADVTHPSPDASSIPSIAAVAASSNNSAFQYNIALRLQAPKQEMILDLEEIIIAQMQIYKNQTSRLPNKIIYYRDGVSEGQLAQIMHFELNAIKRACKRSKADNIQVTCLVVQKRHHVRLFPEKERESDDKNRNVRAGTIVDTEITHPNHIDFYLVSHASIQGTARPTKYRCICNESDFTEDHIEEMTYYLCHMFARCTRAVSLPAPTYYAHLGAYRGRALIQGVNIDLNNLDREQKKLRMKMDQSPMCFV